MAARKWIKNLSAILILGVVVALVTMTVVRARRITRRATGVNPNELIGDALSEYIGFEYTETVEGKLIFALNSVRTLGKSSGWHEIEGVRLQFYQDGEEGPLLTCEKASFNTQTHDARLSEGIHVDFPDGGFFTTEEGRFDNSARRFETTSNVVFVGNGTVGNAGSAAYSLATDRLVLSENVTIRSEDGGLLHAPTVAYNREEQRVVFPDGCKLDFGGSSVSSAFARLDLETIDGTPQRVVFGGGVKLESTADGRLGKVEGWAENLRGTRDGKGNWQIEGTTTGPWVRMLFLGGETFIRRSLDTAVLRAVVAPQGILNMRAEQGVCLLDIPLEGGVRRAESREARLWFDQGQASDVELDAEVVIHGDGVEARGHRARFSATGGVIMLYGNPTGPQRALVISDRGRVQCDQVHFFDATGVIEARGNVQGQLSDVSMFGAGAGAESQPMHFAGAFVQVSEGGDTYELRDNARAWQGHRLLLADEMRYRHADESLRALGHVRTTMPADMIDDSADPSDDVVVVARSLDYGRQRREALYRGNVHYSDPSHHLSASELKVLFDENNEVSSIEAVGEVEMEDLGTGQKITGQQAKRDTRTRLVEVVGTPAQAMDGKGNVVRGRSLTWDQASGSVTVSGDTETIYIPEEEL